MGKSAIAVSVAKRLHTEIISADSRQCYREMTIGTAKPTAVEQEGIRHYFIDEFSVTEALTAGDYEKLALRYLDAIFANNDVAVVCGGTGLYIKALCSGIDEMPGVDSTINEEVNDLYHVNGLAWLQNAVRNEDPLFYKNAETQNPARLLRALVFIRSTGQSITKFRTGHTRARPFNIIKVGLELPRAELYDRVNSRVDQMMKHGLETEARMLYPLRHLKNLQTVGYAELFGYFDGDYSLPEAVNKIKQNTRNYAKRQMTWFTKDKEVHWLPADDDAVTEKIVSLIDAIKQS